MAEAQPSLAIVGPRILTPEGAIYPSVRRFPSLLDAAGHAALGLLRQTTPSQALPHPRRRGLAPRGRLGVGRVLPRPAERLRGAGRLRRDLLHVQRGMDICWRPTRRAGGSASSRRRSSRTSRACPGGATPTPCSSPTTARPQFANRTTTAGGGCCFRGRPHPGRSPARCCGASSRPPPEARRRHATHIRNYQFDQGAPVAVRHHGHRQPPNDRGDTVPLTREAARPDRSTGATPDPTTGARAVPIYQTTATSSVTPTTRRRCSRSGEPGNIYSRS